MITDILQRTEKEAPTFHDVELYRYQDWECGKYFLHKSEVVYPTKVDVSRVVGHDQGYGAMTWAYMLQNLKRMDLRLKDLAKNPEYYLSEVENPDWVFIDVDDKLFIAGGGKHRTTILRYLAHYNPDQFMDGPVARGVKVIRRYLDYETIEIVDDINYNLRKFPYLSFRYVGDHMGERRWQLVNQKQDSRWNFDRNQLVQLHDDLSTTNKVKRVLGQGFNSCFRKSIWTGFNPSIK